MALALTFVVAASLAEPGRAYNNFGNYSCTWPYNSGGSNVLYIFWKDDPDYPPPGDYATAYTQGRLDWNVTATPVYWYYWPSVIKNTFAAQYFAIGDNRTGYTAIQPAGDGTCSYFHTHLNRWKLDNQGWHQLQNTTSHELGHGATVGHSTAPVTATLMRDVYDTRQPTKPQFDDLCAVNTRYFSTAWPATGC